MSEEGRRMYPEQPCVVSSAPPESEDARDARRYRFLRDQARLRQTPRDGSFAWYVPAVAFAWRTQTCDAAVDTAMGEAENE